MPPKQTVTRHPVPGTQHSHSGTVLAFDYGERRVGVAVGDAAVGIAHPLVAIESAAGQVSWDQLAVLVAEWRPSMFVVGMPVRDDGGEHDLMGAVRGFSRQLARRFGLPVELVDERFTSSEGASQLRDAGVSGRAQKPHLDAFAATAILQAYFESEKARA
ncbi:MAG: Holliday junction resolvase RuvX [Burkholderiales bacterium]